MSRLAKYGSAIGNANQVEGERLDGEEGQANFAQTIGRPTGRPMNPGVPAPNRKGRKAQTR